MKTTLSLSLLLSILSFSYAKTNAVTFTGFQYDLNYCNGTAQTFTLKGTIYGTENQDYSMGLAVTTHLNNDGKLDLSTSDYFLTPLEHFKLSDQPKSDVSTEDGETVTVFEKSYTAKDLYDFSSLGSGYNGIHSIFAFLTPGTVTELDVQQKLNFDPPVDDSLVVTSMGGSFPPHDSSQAMKQMVETCS